MQKKYNRHGIYIGFYCVIILVLLTSFAPNIFLDDTDANKYVFYVSGNITAKINGQMCFDTNMEVDNRGQNRTTLEFTLADTKKHVFVLELIEYEEVEPFGEKIYIIKNNTEKLNEDDAFGYLNMINSDELPYYTERGEVRITSFNALECKGHLNLVLKNFKGKQIRLSGDFTAGSLR
ncbi:hypothetical protein H0I23_15285 [Cellulophaga sp. HaHaR_3_176]|uniref:hypothetical protein n=1 Tax=Cellulophaga sp. HaHaR_3_176 TaxID=1942464 RepID=UPI001C1F9437|nr:hypothetical protein [Cellulophaga sp. HaHaR_3_176]QWX83795.1 hypothetical protein H0I23_15285 [Cellulophaga sp. HaHaR_3_176]